MISDVTFLCLSCKKPARKDTVYVTMWLGAELNIIEDVPAHVCDDCGVQYYDPDIEEKIRKLAVAGFPGHLAARTVMVPVFSLENVDSATSVSLPRQERG